MTSVPYAMIGYPVGPIAVGGFLVFAIVGVVLVKRAAGRQAKGDGTDNKGPALGCLTLACGPLVGAALGFCQCRFGEVHPLDVGQTYIAFISIGTFVGLLGGAAFALASALLRGHFQGKQCQDDEL